MRLRNWHKGLLILGIYVSGCLSGFAQPTTRALVTDLMFEVKLSSKWRSVLTEDSFPNYARQDSTWAQAIMAEVRQAVTQQSGASDVRFSRPLTFHLTTQGGLPELQLTRTPANQATYRVAVTGQLNIQHIGVNTQQIPVKNYQFSLQVQMLDTTNATVFSHTTTIPFSVTAQPGQIHGPAELGPADMQSLFSDAIRAAFAAQSRVPKRMYFRPPFNDYTYGQFMTNAAVYQLREIINNGVPVRKGEARNSVLTLTEANGSFETTLEAQQRYISDGGSLTGRYISHATITNPITKMDYDLTAVFDRPVADTVPDARYVSNETLMNIRCTSRRLLVGDFTLSPKNFEGMIGYEVYNINRIEPKHTYELRVNNRLKAIIQRGGIDERTKAQHYTIAFPQGSHINEKGNLLSVFLIFKTAYEFSQDFLLF
jgi:hypothetical protein